MQDVKDAVLYKTAQSHGAVVGAVFDRPYKNVIIHQLFLQRYVHRNVGNIQDIYFQTPSSCDRCYTATSIHIWGICKVKLSSTGQ